MNFSSFWLNLALNRNWVCSKRIVYERILDEIGNAVKKSAIKVESIEELPTELINQIIDDETEVVEYLIGTAFVLCQAYIAGVVSTVTSFHRLAKSQNLLLKTTTGKKQDMLRFGHKENTSSPAELIDAFANYFKHRDEWSVNWDKLTGQQQKTVGIIQSVGAVSGSTGNLRQASRALGNPDFVDTRIFLDKLEQWYLDLIDAYRTELESFFTGESENAQ